jgi:serine/threonine protein kinase
VPPPSEHLLADRYRTIKRLGSGGMATVLLAEDQRLGREVAVKRMHAESPDEVAKRFKREAQLGAALNHPNIVSIFDIETDPENVLIVMEYVSGGTLKDALARGPLERDVALKVLKGIASGLDYAHDLGVVHRDIKPANVLLDADGRAKLADLGIATAAEVTSITNTGAVLGTASYMPPERLDGQPGGVPADIYALATVAYEVLTGRKARQGRSAVEVAAMVMSEPPPDLRLYLPDAPAEAAEVLERGMARDPDARPASAGKLIRELCQAFEAAEGEEEPEPAPVPTAPVAVAVSDTSPSSSPTTHGGRSPEPTYKRQRATGGGRGGRPAGDRRWLLPVAGLVVALLAVAAILAFSGGGDSGSKGGSSSSDSGGVKGDQASGSSGSDAAGGSQAQEGGGSAAGGAGSAGGSAGGSGSAAAADAPAKTVQDFYTLAADDKFEKSWALAGPGLRQQLGGYDGFVGTLKTLQKIEFPKLKTKDQSGSSATVSFQSVATHTDHVDRCTGTVDLTGGGSDWKIEQIHPSCKTG